jgi:hypothetical protein
MGRARGGISATEDPFAATFGGRRGGVRVDIADALAAIREGDFEPALRYVDETVDAEDEVLVSLALALACQLKADAARAVEEPLRASGLLVGDTDEIERPTDDDAPVCAEAVYDVLHERPGRGRGRRLIVDEVHAAVERVAAADAAWHIAKQGAMHLRRYFGYGPYSDLARRVADARGWVPGAGPKMPLLMECLTADAVKLICATDPSDKRAHADALVTVAHSLPPML